MADIVGPLRPSDSWSSTEVRSLQHSHVWTVKGFSQCDCRYLETSVKPVSNDTNLTFRIRLHPQGNKESNKDFTFFQVFHSCTAPKYRAKFAVYNSRNEEIATTVYTGTQQLHGYFEYIRRDLLINHIQPQGIIPKLRQILKHDLSKFSSKKEVAKDLESFHKDGKLTDFMIIVGEHQIAAHKAVLAARSPVFAAMLEPHTEESKNSLVQYDDIESEVLQEMLHFIYSGKSPNLPSMASELLALADRFALPGLKEMADQVLRGNLMIETVCRTLVLADMHGARELKQEAVKFIAQNSSQVIQTDGWSEMVKQHPELVTEVVSAISSEQAPPSGRTTSSSSSSQGGLVAGGSGGGEPVSKRGRLST